MACKQCGSKTQKKFDAELTASLSTLSGKGVSPVYFSQPILVCLDCGFTELLIAGPELSQLRKSVASSGTQGA